MSQKPQKDRITLNVYYRSKSGAIKSNGKQRLKKKKKKAINSVDTGEPR